LQSLQALAAELSVEELVEFTGFLTGDELLRTMSTFHIGVIPDPFDEYNDKISMNKVFEYAWLGIPIVSYRLAETMRLLGPTGMYAKDNCPEALADTIDLLLQDDALRRSQGSAALAHAKQSFNWAQERKILLDAYAMALKARQRTTPARTIARG
jgi:glycosyltransferase involved in cell wall biosynthesis